MATSEATSEGLIVSWVALEVSCLPDAEEHAPSITAAVGARAASASSRRRARPPRSEPGSRMGSGGVMKPG